MKIQSLLIITALALLTGCSSTEPGPTVNTDHECTDTECNVQIVINNPGADSFEISYHFLSYQQGSATLAGELEGSYTVAGYQSTTLSKQFPVTAKPNSVSAGVEVTRLR